MSDYVSQLSRQNLALVSGGSERQEESEMAGDSAKPNPLASDRMRHCLQELRAHFDYVLIDGTSLDAGDGAISLASITDGVVLVLKTHSTRKERTRTRVQELKSGGVRILGAVLNEPTC